MLEIRPLKEFSDEDIHRITGPYSSTQTYRVNYSDDGERTIIEMNLKPLATSFAGRYNHFDEETLARYRDVLSTGLSYGAYQDGQMVGLLVAEEYTWNNTLWVWEFHVAVELRGKGIGRRLMDAVANESRRRGLRAIVCETQNQNVPAIQAYRKMGFRVEGIDISYYTNHDYPDRGVAVFMKRRL